jgi:hypothetical protein
MQIRLNPAPPEGNGGAAPAAPEPAVDVAALTAKLAKLEAAEAKRQKAAEVSGFAEQLKVRENDAIGYARDLHRENTELRDRLAAAEGKVPAGSVVLSAKDAEALERYRKLGKADDLSKALEEGGQAKQRAAQMERAEQVRTVAEAAGFNASVLAKLAGDLQFEIKDEKVGARDVKTAYVVPREGEEGQPAKLADYATKVWADFLPALKPGQSQPAPGLPRGHQPGSPQPNPPQPQGSSNGVQVRSRF